MKKDFYELFNSNEFALKIEDKIHDFYSKVGECFVDYFMSSEEDDDWDTFVKDLQIYPANLEEKGNMIRCFYFLEKSNPNYQDFLRDNPNYREEEDEDYETFLSENPSFEENEIVVKYDDDDEDYDDDFSVKVWSLYLSKNASSYARFLGFLNSHEIDVSDLPSNISDVG